MSKIFNKQKQKQNKTTIIRQASNNGALDGTRVEVVTLNYLLTINYK